MIDERLMKMVYRKNHKDTKDNRNINNRDYNKVMKTCHETLFIIKVQ